MDGHFVSSFYPAYIRFAPVVTVRSGERGEFFQQKQCDGNRNQATVFIRVLNTASEEQSVFDPGAVSCFYLPFVGIAIVQASRAEINQIKTI
jgi:hypothetical protein